MSSSSLNLDPILDNSISFSRVAYEKARLPPTLVIGPYTMYMLSNNWPTAALHDLGIKAIDFPVRNGDVAREVLKYFLSGTPLLSRLEIHAHPDSRILNFDSFERIPVFELAQRFTPKLATLVVKGVLLNVGQLSPWSLRNLDIGMGIERRLSAWSLRNLEIVAGPVVHQSPNWCFADWCLVLENLPALERLVIEDMAEDEETWREAYSALAGGRRIFRVLRGQRTKLVTPPALRVLRLKTGLYMAVTFLTLLSATNLSDMSLWIPLPATVVTWDRYCHILRVVADYYWAKLAVLRLLETANASQVDSNLFEPFSSLEVLEWNYDDCVEVILSNTDVEQAQLLPKLKTLRLHGGLPFRTRYGAEVAHLNDRLLNLIRKRASAGVPLQRVLIDQGHVDEIITTYPTLLTAPVELGWFKTCDSLQGFKEDLEPEWALFSEEKRANWCGYAQVS
ncbi:hypothetical protein CALVIDRAFT_306912 [Calocera viscosa TUFC12733]|uniref:F-box domain-containing protein n=1 Tax=Calocera viscosa (strain TUFC12733) TaxID=1330018 RepID=A0A167IBF0_CALVF|nr:hypothetical protein CALVIDRAFT_306912 [Calocera viscosa TUFC12733]